MCVWLRLKRRHHTTSSASGSGSFWFHMNLMLWLYWSFHRGWFFAASCGAVGFASQLSGPARVGQSDFSLVEQHRVKKLRKSQPLTHSIRGSQPQMHPFQIKCLTPRCTSCVPSVKQTSWTNFYLRGFLFLFWHSCSWIQPLCFIILKNWAYKIKPFSSNKLF